MEGKEAIIARIIGDAEKRAQTILSDAEKTVAESLSDAKEWAEEYRSARLKHLKEEAEEVVSRRKTVAELDCRKAMLAAKRETLDAVFARALEKQVLHQMVHAGRVFGHERQHHGKSDRMQMRRTVRDHVRAVFQFFALFGRKIHTLYLCRLLYHERSAFVKQAKRRTVFALPLPARTGSGAISPPAHCTPYLPVCPVLCLPFSSAYTLI